MFSNNSTGWSSGLVSIGKRRWQWQDFDGHHNKVTHQHYPSFLDIKVHNFVAFLNLLHQKGDESSRKEQGLEVLMGCDWRPLDSWGRNVLAEVKFSFWSQVGYRMGCGMGGGMGCGMGCGMRLHLRHVHVLGYDLLLQGGDPAEQRRDGFNCRRRWKVREGTSPTLWECSCKGKKRELGYIYCTIKIKNNILFLLSLEINATLFFFEFSQFWGHGHLGCGVRMIDACKDTVTRPRKGWNYTSFQIWKY